MLSRMPLIVGNWKMNGDSAFTIKLLTEILTGVKSANNEIVICPPFPYLNAAKKILENSSIKLGAQDVSAYDNGAYTGDVSANMLNDIGCHYVIVGHSERRTYHHENNELISQKCVIAHQHNLIPILCVGETQAERDNNLTYQILKKQLSLLITTFPTDLLEKCILAYEPVWAIGTNKTATPIQAQEVHQFIREQIDKKDSSIAKKIRILYGGSVKPDNAAELFNKSDIDGGLIGGASLKANDFISLCQTKFI